MHDIFVILLEVDHSMNDTLLLCLVSTSRFEYKMHSWYAGVVPSDNRAIAISLNWSLCLGFE